MNFNITPQGNTHLQHKLWEGMKDSFLQEQFGRISKYNTKHFYLCVGRKSISTVAFQE